MHKNAFNGNSMKTTNDMTIIEMNVHSKRPIHRSSHLHPIHTIIPYPLSLFPIHLLIDGKYSFKGSRLSMGEFYTNLFRTTFAL